MEYYLGVMRCDECWWRFTDEGIAFTHEPDDPEREAFDGFDCEFDLYSKSDGVWRIGEVRALRSGVTRHPYEALGGKLAEALRDYVSRKMHDAIEDRVACELPHVMAGIEHDAKEFAAL